MDGQLHGPGKECPGWVVEFGSMVNGLKMFLQNFTLNTWKVSEFSTALYCVCSDDNLDCACLVVALL